jgi:Dolichyl-phosphate-mannose-protein mannosyltransferase
MMKQAKRIAIGIAMLTGAILRFYRIGTQSLWFDEGFTAWAINHRAAELVRLIRADTSPPLYYLLLHIWSELMGRSETALRGMSAVLGVAAIGLFAMCSRRVLRCWTATAVGTWLFALSFMQVAYSQEARGYELLSFCVALAFYGILRHLEKPRMIWLLVIIVASLGGLYTNYFMLVYLTVLAVAALLLEAPMATSRRLKDGLVVAICVAAAYLPWLASLDTQIHRVNGDFWIARPGIDSVCNLLARLCGVAHFWSWDRSVHLLFPDVATDLPRLVTVALNIGVVSAAALLRGRKRKSALALAICGLGPPLAVAIYSQWGRPLLLPAAFLPSTGFLAMLAAGPITWAATRFGRTFACISAALLLILSAATLWGFEREQAKEDWRSVAHFVAALPPVHQRLIIFVANEGQLPFDFYYQSRRGEVETGAPAGFFDIDPPRTERRVLSDADVSGVKSLIQSSQWEDIVLIVSHDSYADPDGRTLRCVSGLAKPVDQIAFPSIPGEPALITIWRFAKQ